MSRAERLLQLIQIMRRYRQPVRGKALADELGVSIRTVYRDIASLQAQGATIEGEPGVGYVLKAGFTLPPLMFSTEEVEALVLGSRWVAARADGQLRDAALSAVVRIAAVLPPALRDDLETSPLLIGPGAVVPADAIDPALLRKAIRTERKLALVYRDSVGTPTRRIVWPFALAFFDSVRVLLAWCELRQGIRHFRTDRISVAELTEVRYPKRRQILLKEWRDVEKIPQPLR